MLKQVLKAKRLRRIDRVRLSKKCWLGRQDSNLRMPVPKTVLGAFFLRASLLNFGIIHRRISKTYIETADGQRGQWGSSRAPIRTKRATVIGAYEWVPV